MIDVEEIFNERAAIRQYLGGYSKEEAERLAYEDTKKIMERYNEKTNNDAILLSFDKL